MPFEGLIDLGAERAKLENRVAEQRKYLEGSEKKLANSNFGERAPAEVVERVTAEAPEPDEPADAPKPTEPGGKDYEADIERLE